MSIIVNGGGLTALRKVLSYPYSGLETKMNPTALQDKPVAGESRAKAAVSGLCPFERKDGCHNKVRVALSRLGMTAYPYIIDRFNGFVNRLLGLDENT